MAKNYREGDYVPGKGILTPYGTYRKTEKEMQPATYKGVELRGSQEDLVRQIREIDSKSPAPNSRLSSNIGTDIPFRNDEQATRSGLYGKEAQDKIFDFDRGTGAIVDPKMSRTEASGFANEFGLGGMNLENEFVGLRRSKAEQKARDILNKKQSQVSSRTSYTYNPESISNFRKSFNDLKFKIDENKNEPWTDKKTKKEKNQSILNSFTPQLASLFNTKEDFLNAQQDKEFDRLLKDYERLGGSRNDIASKIGQNVSVVNETQNPDGTFNVTYSDGQTRNVAYQTNNDGSVTPVFQDSGNQTLDQYLGAMDTKVKQKAMESLIPEKKIAQDQIAFEQSIPEMYRQYYFGDEDTIGVLQRKKLEAEENIKILEKEAKLETASAKSRADLLSRKADFELEKADAEIEENRLIAKNYLVGQLAKLGALNTTGKAPEAVANLEQKYQRQSAELKTTYELSKQELKLNLRDKINEIEIQKDQDILKTKQDLTKSEDSAWKEIFKLQIEAERKQFNLIDNFARDFRQRTDKYTTEAKREAEKYAKELANTLSAFDLSGFREGDFVFKKDKKGKRVDGGILSPTGEVRDINEILESSKGPDGYVNSDTYRQMFERYTASGGTRSKFLSLYPPAKYVNPKDTSLPSFLRFGSSARGEAKNSTQDEIDVEAWLNS